MRWKARQPDPLPHAGMIRTLCVFLMLPRTIAGETRWLEWVTIDQEFVEPWYEPSRWVDRKWVD